MYHKYVTAEEAKEITMKLMKEGIDYYIERCTYFELKLKLLVVALPEGSCDEEYLKGLDFAK